MIRQSDYQQLAKTLQQMCERDIVRLIFAWTDAAIDASLDEGRDIEQEARGVVMRCRYEIEYRRRTWAKNDD